MATEMQKRLQETIKDFSLPTFEEIPTVGLYLEQTSNFINSYLEELLGTKLTPSMISNYVKKNLIARPENYFLHERPGAGNGKKQAAERGKPL